MSSVELSVIAPCFNEEGNIDLLARRVQQALEPLKGRFELICVDDASTDSTREKIQEAEQTYPFLVGAFHEKNQGIVGGWQTGLETSQGTFVVTIDADLQYRPEDILPMYERIRQGDADLVQGWRKTQVQRGMLRQVLTAGLSFLLNFTFGMRLRDNKSGFILYRREVLADLLRFRSEFTYFQHFITIAAHWSGYRIVQIPVTFDRRFSGESFISNPFGFSLKAAADIPRAVGLFRFNRARVRTKG